MPEPISLNKVVNNLPLTAGTDPDTDAQQLPSANPSSDLSQFLEEPNTDEPKKIAKLDPNRPDPMVEPKANARSKSLDLGGGIMLDAVLIPAGSFTMGSDKENDKDAKDDELPAHKVTLTKDFYMGKYTVTIGQFKRFVADSGYKTEAETDREGGGGWNNAVGNFEGRKPKYTWKNAGFSQDEDHPVVNVTWNDAQEFCAWLSEKTGERVRLPSEAEWEYSCRAGTKSIYHNGDNSDGLVAIGNAADTSFAQSYQNAVWAIGRVTQDDGYSFTAPVGKFKPNDFGLYDMHGNVWEWCQDWYAKDYYAGGNRVDPTGPTVGTRRVMRGGSFTLLPRFCRAASRGIVEPTFRGCSAGFRVVVVR